MGRAKRYPSIVMEAALDGFRFALPILQEGMHPHSRGAMRPKLCDLRCPRKTKRAQGKPGALSTRDRAHKMHTGDRKVRRNTRPSLRNGFNGLYRALPGAEFLWPPSLTNYRSIEARLSPMNLHQL